MLNPLFKVHLELNRPHSEWIMWIDFGKRKESVHFNIPSEIFYFLMMTAALTDNY